MMYITILDYSLGIVDIYSISNDTDPEDFLVDKGYHLGDIEYMITDNLNLNIKI